MPIQRNPIAETYNPLFPKNLFSIFKACWPNDKCRNNGINTQLSFMPLAFDFTFKLSVVNDIL